jgi:methylmalonyl-CoA mutase C-terminal domain/subunit
MFFTLGGGIIPKKDFPLLYDASIKAIFVPGATLESIVKYINNNIKARL